MKENNFNEFKNERNFLSYVHKFDFIFMIRSLKQIESESGSEKATKKEQQIVFIL